jgi:hypothetical protein
LLTLSAFQENFPVGVDGIADISLTGRSYNGKYYPNLNLAQFYAPTVEIDKSRFQKKKEEPQQIKTTPVAQAKPQQQIIQTQVVQNNPSQNSQQFDEFKSSSYDDLVF